ncbi:ATP synthase subunit s, mitochondrial [Anoplophora glabripennis]|uniref:ATP synthase subunit s, mitochondrial n=1 Tax=Anoplophora glabripennis TaxID=217634 RepID=UPI0008754ACB|nr:ATP synthase subunit s, mitochondrial [Anoplophora glabripennis]
MSTTLNVLRRHLLGFYQSKRSLFHWINLQFNVVDENRRNSFGPDRICAEWILRNGGTVKWVNSNEILSDYNELPKEGTMLQLQVIDASNSSIMHNGFAHFKGCNYITKVVFHKCNYLEDRAFEELHYLKKSLLFLQISSCPNISEKGLMHLHVLTKVRELIMFDLPSVKNKNNIVHILKSSLPQCYIKY